MPRRKAPKGPGTDKPKLAKKRAKVTPTVALPTVAAQPQTQPQPVAGPSIIPWKQQLSNLVANLPPLPPAATPSTWTPETMAASLEAYTGWATSIRQWHRELESTLLEPNLDGLLEMISTPFAPPLTLAEAETNLPPNTLHAYLVNEVTPNYRRFRALSTPSLSEHVALESLGMALDDMLAQHVLPHIAPGHSSDVASASFLQFVVHELMPSWVRFRGRNVEAVRRATGGDEVVNRLVSSLERALEGQVRCGCHPERL